MFNNQINPMSVFLKAGKLVVQTLSRVFPACCFISAATVEAQHPN